MIAKLDGHKVLNNKTRTKHRPPQTMGATINQQQQNHRLRTDSSQTSGGLNEFYWYQIFALDSVVVKTQTLFSSYVGFPNYCNVSSQGNNLINLTHYDVTKKRSYDSQTVQTKENLKLSHSGPSQRQASGANPLIKALCQDH